MRFPPVSSPARGKHKRRTPLLGAPKKGVLRGAKRPSWKLVGLAGIAGVAATGVVVARSRRAQRELPPDELRERLHARLAGIEPASATTPEAPPA